ncbi:hypothetical protein [Aestuariivirga sp.]|uniref:hypothetical protein n=1 Tax=Aestuariivirga sp. TaxID=2650926 RepID=UPI003BABA245
MGPFETSDPGIAPRRYEGILAADSKRSQFICGDADGINLGANIDFEAFPGDVEAATLKADCPSASQIIRNITVYERCNATPATGPEWANILLNAAGVLVIRGAFEDMSAVDDPSALFREIIAEERAAGASAGDHFAQAGVGDRVWNSLQKLCLRAPQGYDVTWRTR